MKDGGPSVTNVARHCGARDEAAPAGPSVAFDAPRIGRPVLDCLEAGAAAGGRPGRERGGTVVADLTSMWHAEHLQFLRLLELFDAQVQAFHEGGQPNYELMHDTVFYLKHYGDRFHHPRENVAFERLAVHDPSMRTKLARLLQEHRVLGAHGSHLLDRLAEVDSDLLAPRDALESAAATYLVYYRHHLNTEERDILPRAQQLFTDADWAAVMAAVPHEPDPLFGEHPHERFRELRRLIAREAG